MKKYFVIVFCIFIGASLDALDFNITGAGARAAGMGGAFIGVADDATAVVWNPAGLTILQRPEASIVCRSISEKYEWSDEDEEEKQSHFVLNFISAAYPLMGGKLVTAIAYQKQLDFYYSSDDEENTGGANTITPGVGYQIVPILSAGFSANIWTGSAEINDLGDVTTMDFTGFNMVFGALADFSYLQNPVPFKLGICLKTPFNLQIDVDDGYNTWTNEVEMPLMIGFGTSYRFGENLTLAADYEMRKYGASEIVYEDGSSVPLCDSEEDLTQFRVGGEYTIITDFAVIPLRLGYQNVPTLIADEDENQVIGSGFSFGSGLIFDRFSFDATFQISGYEYEHYWWGEILNSKTTLTFSGIVYY